MNSPRKNKDRVFSVVDERLANFRRDFLKRISLKKNIKRAKLKEIGKAGTISTPEKAMAAFPTTGNLKVTGPPALITEMVFPACASVFVLPNENSQQKNLQPMSSC